MLRRILSVLIAVVMVLGVLSAGPEKITAKAEDNAIVKFESYNFPGYFIRHQKGNAKIDSVINPIEDCEWRIVPGLADPGCVSIESVNFPGEYLRHKDSVVYREKPDGTDLFKKDATFKLVSGLKDSSGISFQSYNFPDKYIRHSNFYLRIDAPATDLDKQDATFYKRSFIPYDWSWVRGAVFVPTHAVNECQQWEEYDPDINDRELYYCSVYGINMVRVYLHYLVWEKDKTTFLKNIEDFLTRADKYGIKVEFVFFDDCWDPNPKLGPYPSPVFGVHNSRWVQCPGNYIKENYAAYKPKLQAYVQDVVNAHKSDRRISFWEPYNEPGNGKSGLYYDVTNQILKDSRTWIKSTGTDIPITSTDFANTVAPAMSDFYSFHSYEPDYPGPRGPNVLCTECMNRSAQSVPGVDNAFFHNKTGYIVWEAGIGRDNCRYPWGNTTTEPTTPFHGIIYPDGHPWALEDVKAIRNDDLSNLPVFDVQYYSDSNFTTLKKSSITPMIHFDLGNEFGTGSPDASAGIGIDNFSIRWTGSVLSTSAGTYTFYADCDNITKIWVGGNLVVNKTNSGRAEVSGRINLDANKLYSLKVEYVHGTGDASLHVRYSGPDFGKKILLGRRDPGVNGGTIPAATIVPTATPSNIPVPTPTTTPTPAGTDEFEFKIQTQFIPQTLVPNQMMTARVVAQNVSLQPYAGTKDVLLIVALYDKNNTMVNVSYISKGIPYQAAETLSAGFKLPKDITGCSAKAFMWDGQDIKDSNMIPLSNVVEVQEGVTITPAISPATTPTITPTVTPSIPSLASGQYKLNSTFWNPRIKNVITQWIAHCNEKLSDLNLAEGGINNFIQAGNKLSGQAYTQRKGDYWSDAYLLNEVEAMCLALQVDPQGDQDIIKAQSNIKSKLNEWIPVILKAQEKDGYFQTYFTLTGEPRWTNRGAHEGYVAGYFLEAAIAHYNMTGRNDPSMYNAAKKLADCWCNNIGPSPKKTWWDGHEEIELALCKLARLANEVEGTGKGDKYVQLAKFLMDSRHGGGTYDQSQDYPVNQTEAVGHSVRAVYLYSGMTDVAALTGDTAYKNAVLKLWDNVVNKKMYVTGGVGSGETAEGFGANYSLPNTSYCESCSACGMLFWQNRMNSLFQEAKYADIMELTLYNNVLGSLDLNGKNFTYTNPLDQDFTRYEWHGCPCCIGNISRTLLQLPTWMYTVNNDSLFVNLFIGSMVNVGNVAGTNVQLTQRTDYPFNGNVSILVNPSSSRTFSIKIRVPDRSVSTCYSSSPDVSGISSITVNGSIVTPVIEKGYAVITRNWSAGDKIDLVLPMQVQRVKAGSNVAADAGKVALQVGPLVYNIESADYPNRNLNSLILNPDTALTTQWNGNILGGTMVVKGTFADGTPLNAIPNYLRNNRGGRSIVWIKDQEPNLISPIAFKSVPSSSFCSSWESVYGLNDQVEPANSNDRSGLIYGNYNHKTTEWVQYDFDKSYTISSTDIYWFNDNQGLLTPASWYMQYWNGSAWVNVPNPSGYGLDLNKWNHSNFSPVTTTKVRVYINPGAASTGIAEWKVQ